MFDFEEATVLCGLSAENVFERIRKHYTDNK